MRLQVGEIVSTSGRPRGDTISNKVALLEYYSHDQRQCEDEVTTLIALLKLPFSYLRNVGTLATL